MHVPADAVAAITRQNMTASAAAITPRAGVCRRRARSAMDLNHDAMPGGERKDLVGPWLFRQFVVEVFIPAFLLFMRQNLKDIRYLGSLKLPLSSLTFSPSGRSSSIGLPAFIFISSLRSTILTALLSMV